MKNRAFHLSIGCHSVEESADFFEQVLDSKIVHRDPSGYINIDFYGTQVTLKSIPCSHSLEETLKTQELHFGVNFSLREFDEVAEKIMSTGYSGILGAPKTVDEGTEMERKKLYVKCPTGYIFEFKGYQ